MMISIRKGESFDEKYCLGSELGQVLWDITKMKRYISENKIPIREFNTIELYRQNPSNINQQAVDDGAGLGSTRSV